MAINEEKNAAMQKIMAMQAKAFSLSKEERMHLCDMGFYNQTIRGYLILAMQNAGFPKEEIKRALYGLKLAFDDTSAAEAEDIDL